MTRAKVLLSALTLLAMLALAIAPAASAAGNGADTPTDTQQSGPGFNQHQKGDESDVNVCSTAVPDGVAHCNSRVRTDDKAKNAKPARANQAEPLAGTMGNGGAYDPSYLQSAYNLSAIAATGGAGQTIAIVDAYDDPSAERDMAYYRSYFGLSSCTSSNGCFTKINQNGGTTYPTSDTGWAQEISLDLDMASAICPNCKILLVEANSANFSDLATAVNTAAARGAKAISNSYGGTEWSSEAGMDSAYNHPGIAVTVSAGDSGYGVEYPAASPYVTAVGGTSLTQNSNTGTRNGSESVWSGTGSGCSAYEAKPSWQTDSGCSRRTVADTSAVADPNTGVWVYYGSGWYVFGGTSAASPIIAATYALAGNAPSSNQLASYPYSHTTSLNDVTSGSNGSCSTAYLCHGVSGYDGPTGLGTPNGTTAFTPAGSTTPPAPSAPSVSSLSPASGPSAGGTTVTINGSGFTGATGVSFGANPASSFTVNSDTTITATAPAGTGTVDVTVTSGGKTSSTSPGDQFTYTTTAPAPSFSITASPSSQTVSRYSATQYTVNVTATSGSPTVALSVSGLPHGASASFSPSSVAGTGTSILTVTAGKSTGAYTLTITGNSGSVSQTSRVTLNVTR